jgi:hypothetical protein
MLTVFLVVLVVVLLVTQARLARHLVQELLDKEMLVVATVERQTEAVVAVALVLLELSLRAMVVLVVLVLLSV